MSFVSRNLKDKVVYWPPAPADRLGDKTYGDPVEMKARWEFVVEQFIDGKGAVFVSSAQVYCEKDVALEGVLWLGNLAELEFDEDPLANEGASEIRLYEKIPKRKAKKGANQSKWVRIATV